MRLDWRLAGAALLLTLLGASLLLGRIPLALAIGYAAMSGLSLLAYRLDKHFAATGHWRISERTLHGLDLCLGIFGGLLGQALFRHKTRKSGYGTATMLIAAVHVLVLSGLASGLIDANAVIPSLTAIITGFL